MMEKWDGRERRRITPDGREGRRPSDRHCAEHHLLWEKHDEATDAYRTTTCGKITLINAELDKMVSWKIFAFLFTFSVLVVGAGFGFFGNKIEKLGDKQEASMDSLQAVVYGMATTQSVMMLKINEIEKRNDRIDGKTK
jgi:cation transport ATPase